MKISKVVQKKHIYVYVGFLISGFIISLLISFYCGTSKYNHLCRVSKEEIIPENINLTDFVNCKFNTLTIDTWSLKVSFYVTSFFLHILLAAFSDKKQILKNFFTSVTIFFIFLIVTQFLQLFMQRVSYEGWQDAEWVVSRGGLIFNIENIKYPLFSLLNLFIVFIFILYSLCAPMIVSLIFRSEQGQFSIKRFILYVLVSVIIQIIIFVGTFPVTIISLLFLG